MTCFFEISDIWDWRCQHETGLSYDKFSVKCQIEVNERRVRALLERSVNVPSQFRNHVYANR